MEEVPPCSSQNLSTVNLTQAPFVSCVSIVYLQHAQLWPTHADSELAGAVQAEAADEAGAGEAHPGVLMCPVR